MSVAGEGTPEPGATGGAGDGESINVPAPDPEDGEGEGTEGGERAAAGGERPNHKERKQNRMREATARAEAAERRAAETAERLARIERENAEVRGYLAREQEERSRRGSDEGVEAQVTRLRDEAQMHLERSAVASKAGDRQAAAREMNLYHDKIEEAREARRAPQRAAEVEQMVSERLQAAQANHIPAPIQSALNRCAQEFPWFYTDSDGRDLMDVKINRLRAEGKPLSYENLRAAAAETQKKLGLGGRQAPTEQNRQRYQAIGGGEGSGGDDGGTVSVPWTAADKKFAHAMFPKLEGAELKKAYGDHMAAAKRRGEW